MLDGHLRFVGGAQGVQPGEQEGLQRLGAARLHQPQRHLLEAGGRRRQLRPRALKLSWAGCAWRHSLPLMWVERRCYVQ